MMRVCEVEHRMGNQDHKLFMLTQKLSGKRVISDLDHGSFSDPLPKLSLGGPKLFSITANYQRRALLLPLPVFLYAHFPLVHVALSRTRLH